MYTLNKFLSKISPTNFYYAAWLLTIAALFGSLFYSNVLMLPPCDLCWYQRILMYPLVVIFTVGLLLKDKNLPFYVLPLALMGTLVAIYQLLLQAGVFQEASILCTSGVSCTIEYDYPFLKVFTIPMQSFAGFSLITILTLLGYKYSSEADTSNS